MCVCVCVYLYMDVCVCVLQTDFGIVCHSDTLLCTYFQVRSRRASFFSFLFFLDCDFSFHSQPYQCARPPSADRSC